MVTLTTSCTERPGMLIYSRGKRLRAPVWRHLNLAVDVARVIQQVNLRSHNVVHTVHPRNHPAEAQRGVPAANPLLIDEVWSVACRLHIHKVQPRGTGGVT